MSEIVNDLALPIALILGVVLGLFIIDTIVQSFRDKSRSELVRKTIAETDELLS